MFNTVLRAYVESLSHFLIGLFVFLLLTFKNSLHILNISPLSDL